MTTAMGHEPEATPPAPTTLLETVEHEALGYRAWGTPVGDFLARELEKLAQLIQWTHATTPEEHEARVEAWEAEIREQHEAIGYEEGLRAGRSECRCGFQGPLD